MQRWSVTMYRIIWKSDMFVVARNNRFASTMIVAMTPSKDGVRHIEHRADGNVGGGLDIIQYVTDANDDHEIGDYMLDHYFTGHPYGFCKCADDAHLIPE